MNQKAKTTFLILVLIQAAHSVEEYVGKLWEVFPPATYVCRLVSDNLVVGFLTINIGLFIFGLVCWLIPVSRGLSFAPVVVWFWIVIETANGIVHTSWSAVEGAYTPGLATAPFLFVAAIYLASQLVTRPISAT